MGQDQMPQLRGQAAYEAQIDTLGDIKKVFGAASGIASVAAPFIPGAGLAATGLGTASGLLNMATSGQDTAHVHSGGGSYNTPQYGYGKDEKGSFYTSENGTKDVDKYGFAYKNPKVNVATSFHAPLIEEPKPKPLPASAAPQHIETPSPIQAAPSPQASPVQRPQPIDSSMSEPTQTRQIQNVGIKIKPRKQKTKVGKQKK